MDGLLASRQLGGFVGAASGGLAGGGMAAFVSGLAGGAGGLAGGAGRLAAGGLDGWLAIAGGPPIRS